MGPTAPIAGSLCREVTDLAGARAVVGRAERALSPGKDSFNRMRLLRDAMDARNAASPASASRRFAGGLVLHCGQAPILQADDRIWIAPMSILWSG